MDISVIVLNRNRGRFLGRCLRSCLSQSLPKNKYEIIVVDDYSTDESPIVINSFGDSVRPIFLKKNVGISRASNIGIEKALGNLVIRVDADDYIAEHTLLFLSEIMHANKDIGFAYTDHFRVDEKGKILKRVDLDSLDKILNHGAGVMFRKSNLEALGLYDENFQVAEDYDLILRYLKNFNGFHLPLPLYRYCRHSGNITKNRKLRNEHIFKANQKSKGMR